MPGARSVYSSSSGEKSSTFSEKELACVRGFQFAFSLIIYPLSFVRKNFTRLVCRFAGLPVGMVEQPLRWFFVRHFPDTRKTAPWIIYSCTLFIQEETNKIVPSSLCSTFFFVDYD